MCLTSETKSVTQFLGISATRDALLTTELVTKYLLHFQDFFVQTLFT